VPSREETAPNYSICSSESDRPSRLWDFAGDELRAITLFICRYNGRKIDGPRRESSGVGHTGFVVRGSLRPRALIICVVFVDKAEAGFRKNLLRGYELK
jgi:hypothetical protein